MIPTIIIIPFDQLRQLQIGMHVGIMVIFVEDRGDRGK
jgi:hypothetical protein